MLGWTPTITANAAAVTLTFADASTAEANAAVFRNEFSATNDDVNGDLEALSRALAGVMTVDVRGRDVILSARFTTGQWDQFVRAATGEKGRAEVDVAIAVARTGAFAVAMIFPPVGKRLVRAVRAMKSIK